MSHPSVSQPPAAGDAAALAAADAQGELLRVQRRVEAARAVLLNLLQDVVAAESRLDASQASQLIAANEQLVVAALRDQADAQTAKRSLSEASRAAEIDPLTALPNRTLMQDRLAQAMAGAKRRTTRCALLFMDLDNFKQVNDTQGHAAGDEVLKAVARRLSHAVREADTVSRHGGDEFLVLLSEVSHAADAASIASKLLAALREPLRVGDIELHLTASVGISLYPDDGDSIDALIEQADAAMYCAKSQGDGKIALHGEVVQPLPEGEPVAASTAHGHTLVAHELRHAQLHEANEQLVRAALGAQALQAGAERAQQRQADFMAAVFEELAQPFAPLLPCSSDPGSVLPRVQAMVDQQAARVSRLVHAASVRASGAGAGPSMGQRVCDLVAIIDATWAELRQLLDLRHQRLTVVVPAGPIAVRGDDERVSLVVSNLLDNASRYTADDGTIGLEVAVQGNSVLLSVSADGIGIVPEVVLPRGLEPSGRDNRASAGLGLPVVRALVSELGGTVLADSAGRGRGSRFVVTLPLACEGDAGAPAASPALA